MAEQPCPECGGMGHEPNSPKRCTKCAGRGWTFKADAGTAGAWADIFRDRRGS